jgi:hypothetical protein
MGTRNRERRKAKQKRRSERRRAPGFAADRAPEMSPAEITEAMVVDCAIAVRDGLVESAERGLTTLADEAPGLDRGLVDRTVLALLQRTVDRAWRRGWQPADVARVVERQRGAGHARLAVDAMAAAMRAYAAATVSERWDAQLGALGAAVWWDRDDRHVGAWAEREGVDRKAAIRCGIELLVTIDLLPPLPRLGPPPGEATEPARTLRRAAAAGPPADPRMLDRVRALLAKAESTTFPEEAEAYTAKAQELMARHSIDQAMLGARAGARHVPDAVRIGVDSPYEAAKALLLQNVAEANRCRSIWSGELGFATVFGFPTDLEAVELLHTSLLVQATAAMLHAGPQRDRWGRSRTRSFRLSFLNAYAIRIGQRLRQATDAASADAAAQPGHAGLLPVLAARDEEVQASVRAAFPTSRSRDISVSNRDGWASGTAAADLASLSPRRAVGSRS